MSFSEWYGTELSGVELNAMRMQWNGTGYNVIK